MKFPNFLWVIIFTNISLFSMNNFNVEGRIVDSKTKEGIENVNVFVEDLGVGTASVSYTHLTLPTICSV